MIRLLRAEFARCFTGKLFWLVVLFYVVLASSFNVLTYATTKSEDFSNIFTDKTLYIGLISMGLTAAVFVAFHAGSEFDEGTIRNKLIAGNTKTGIYICDLAVCSAALIIIQYLYSFIAYAFSYILFGALHHSFSVMMQLQLIGALGTIAVTAFMLMITMIVRSRTIAVTVCMIAAIVFFIACVAIINELEEHSMELMDAGPEIISAEKYAVLDKYSYVYGVGSDDLFGAELAVKEFFYDSLLQSQALRFSDERSLPYHWEFMVIYNIAITLVTTLIGTVSFRRLDLK